MENSSSPSASSLSSPSVLEEPKQEFHELLESLPKEPFLRSGLRLYQDFWCPMHLLQNVISFQNHFHAQDTDIILTSFPKSGTTWLKTIIFSVVNRTKFSISDSPLLTKFSHKLVPNVELNVFQNNEIPDLTSMPSSGLFNTHVPYASLPKSIKQSKCRIVYICRNPYDNLVSFWHFVSQASDFGTLGWTFQEFVDKFCEGKVPFGPFWSHVLGYWKESTESPHKVLFLKYEDLQEDIISQIKRLAEFIGFPFSPDELRQGVAEDISKLCSFNVMKDLEVNKNGNFASRFAKKSYFRKGEVGDWVNHLNPSMLERLNKINEERFEDSGLSFKYLSS